MLDRFPVLRVGLLGAALVCAVEALAQSGSTPTWPDPVPNRPPVAEKDKKPAPKRTIAGMWGSRLGNQAKGVQLRPNDGSPENQLPYTPYGLQIYRSHKALEGADAVPPAQNNDPRVSCEPLGMPRYNHYDLGVKISRTSTRWRFCTTTTIGGARSGLMAGRCRSCWTAVSK
jgi:hypothetical protein